MLNMGTTIQLVLTFHGYEWGQEDCRQEKAVNPEFSLLKISFKAKLGLFLQRGSWEIPVSSSTSNSPLCPNSKWKAEQTEKSTSLLGSIREGEQDEALPPRSDRRTYDAENNPLSEQRLTRRNYLGNPHQARKPELWLSSVWTTLRAENSRGTQWWVGSSRGRHNIVFLLQELDQALTVKSKKNPLMLPALLRKVFPQETSRPEPNLPGFYRA